MDGNGRWARERGEDRVFGHANGVDSVRAVVRAAGELGVEFLTLYAFSTENWSRPVEEINALMELLVREPGRRGGRAHRPRRPAASMGALGSLPEACREALRDVEEPDRRLRISP